MANTERDDPGDEPLDMIAEIDVDAPTSAKVAPGVYHGPGAFYSVRLRFVPRVGDLISLYSIVDTFNKDPAGHWYEVVQVTHDFQDFDARHPDYRPSHGVVVHVRPFNGPVNLTPAQTIGQRIDALRLEAGWTQEALAEKVTISKEMVGRHINGVAMPRPPTLLLYANAFSAALKPRIFSAKNLAEVQ